MKRLPVAALVIAGTLWGTTVPLSKDALGWAGPGWLTALRFALAAPVLGLLAQRGLGRALRPEVVLTGAAGYGLVILLQNAGIARTSATHAAILIGALPAMVAVLCVLLGLAPVRPLAGIGFAAALAGVALVAGGGGAGGDLFGDGLVLVSLVVSAVFTIGQSRLLEGGDVVAVTAVQLGGAAVASTAAAVLLEGGPPVPAGAGDLAVLGALVVVGTLLPFTLFAYGQSKVAPEVAGAFMNLEPLVGVAAGVLVLGDPFGVSQALGGVAILAGIGLSTRPRATDGTGSGDGRAPRGHEAGGQPRTSVPEMPTQRADRDVGDAEVAEVLRILRGMQYVGDDQPTAGPQDADRLVDGLQAT
jgi:drug/metabolite transporter (DMT)-like permease